MSRYKRIPETIRKSKLTQIQRILGEDYSNKSDKAINEKFRLVSKIKSLKAKATEVKNNGFDIEGLTIDEIESLLSQIRKEKQNQVSVEERNLRTKKCMLTTLTNMGISVESLSDDNIIQIWSELQKNNVIKRMRNTLKNHDIYHDDMSDDDIRSEYSRFISYLQRNRSDNEKKQISEKMSNRHKQRSKEDKEKIEKKRRATNLIKYGCENVMQSAEIIKRSVKKSKSYRNYTMPSGRIIKIQGYEDLVLDFLIKNRKINEDNIIVEKDKIPKIEYINSSDNQNHRYYPDIYLKEQNILIEVKSDFLFKKEKDVILLKKRACENLGFKFHLVVLHSRKSQIKLKI